MSFQLHRATHVEMKKVLTLSIGFAENFVVVFEINGKPAVLDRKNRSRQGIQAVNGRGEYTC